jgi:O-antigen/teichoic acid export membrane protein
MQVIKQNSYKQIFKATSIFGGVQIVNIFILIVRSKVIAIFLGPAGMGITALLTSSTGLISALTHFGLGTSAVKNVATAYGSGDETKLAQTIRVFRKLVWVTGLLGFIICLVLSPWLSSIAFGNKKYTIAFMLISVTLLLTQISDGQTVILRGTRKIKHMAKSSMIGSLIGLIVSAPIYYFWGEAGIAPAIVITAVLALIATWYYSRQVFVPKVQIDKAILYSESKDMLKMGFLISLSGLISLGTSYLMRIFISNHGSIADVGLYNAGFSIIGTYVGLVFTAMGTDYYPRLAAVASNNNKCKEEINQQAEIALLILAPILIIFLVFINYAIILLYSKQFVSITSMVQWAALGIFFKSTSWAIGIVFISKGDSKMFFWNELVANIYILILNLLGYYYFGLTGLGMSFLIGYILHVIQMYFVTKKFYGFSFDNKFVKIFSIQFCLAILCFLVVYFLKASLVYSLGSIIILVSIVFSWKEMNNRINLNIVLKNFYNQKLRGK